MNFGFDSIVRHHFFSLESFRTFQNQQNDLWIRKSSKKTHHFPKFSNCSVAWIRPWPCQISGHRIFWTMTLCRNQHTYFNYILTKRYQKPTEGSRENRQYRAYVFQSPKLRPIHPRGENKIALDDILIICFYRLYKPCFGCINPTLVRQDLWPQNLLDHEALQEPRYIL